MSKSTKPPMDPLATFDLRKQPMTREFDISQRWGPIDREEVLGLLVNAIKERTSAAIIGPAGSGKTVIMRALVDNLPEARYKTHYIKVTGISTRDLCREIAAAMGCKPANQYNTLVRVIQQRMLESTDHDGLRPVLIMDEAHDFRFNVLPIIRILTNFNMDSRLVVSIVLCGQPPLAAMLARADMEAVSRRLAYCATLKNLTREDTKEYIRHRLFMVGGKSDIFNPRALEAIYEIGGGNLRATDSLAKTAMDIAAAKQCTQVDESHVVQAKERLLI